MFPYTEEEISAKVAKAAAFYWETRRRQARKQKRSGTQDAGKRGQVTGGKHLDGFAKLVQEIGIKAGCRKEDIFSIPRFRCQVITGRKRTGTSFSCVMANCWRRLN